MTRWVQTEDEQAELKLKALRGYWKDKDGKFWFNDETGADVCGPYETLAECEAACDEYARTL